MSMIQFLKLREEHLEMVLKWRLKPEVSQYMFTDVRDSMDDQLRWFRRVSNDPGYRYWIIVYRYVPIGLINLAGIDWNNRHLCAGYYIGELEYRSLGAIIPPYLYNYVFNEMKFRKIFGEVMAGNENVIKLYQIHGYSQVGVYRDHIWKGDQFHDVVLIELLSESWLKQTRYQRYTGQFE